MIFAVSALELPSLFIVSAIRCHDAMRAPPPSRRLPLFPQRFPPTSYLHRDTSTPVADAGRERREADIMVADIMLLHFRRQ